MKVFLKVENVVTWIYKTISNITKFLQLLINKISDLLTFDAISWKNLHNLSLLQQKKIICIKSEKSETLIKTLLKICQSAFMKCVSLGH